MYNPKDLWHEPYYNPDLSVNPNCKLFLWWSQDRIDKYLQRMQEWI